MSIIVVIVIFTIWDFIIEYSSTSYGLWTYYWPAELMIGGKLPFTTPIMVMLYSTTIYFIWPAAERLSEGMGWWKALGVYLLFTLIVWSTLNTALLLIHRFITGIMPIPLDISLSHDLLTDEMIHDLSYRYIGMFPPTG